MYLMHFNPNHDPKTGRFTFTTFISGSSKTQNPDSPYYRKELPKEVRSKIDSYMDSGDKIIVGDAPGIDRQVQDYLNSKGYQNVEVYGPGKEVRYSANSKWNTKTIESGKYAPDTDEWRAEKDVFMSKIADRGLAIVLENGGAGATRDNVDRLVSQNKDVSVFELDSKGGIKQISAETINNSSDDLMHFNPYHDKLGRFAKSPINKSELPSYGGKGVRSPLNEELKEVYENDYIIKKGTQYQRITSAKDEKFNKRTYVSGGMYQYDELFTNNGDFTYLDIYQTKRDAVIAGKKTIESILKEIGNEPADKILKALNTDWSDEKKADDVYDKDNDGRAYVDFIYKDTYGIADEFISKLRSKGYDGLPDPLDSYMGPSGNGLESDATIFINNVLDKKLSIQTVY